MEGEEVVEVVVVAVRSTGGAAMANFAASAEAACDDADDGEEISNFHSLELVYTISGDLKQS